MDMSLSKLRELVMDMDTWNAAVHEVTKSRTQLSDWTELIHYFRIFQGLQEILFFKYEKQIVIIFPALLNDSLAEYLILLTFYFSSIL